MVEKDDFSCLVKTRRTSSFNFLPPLNGKHKEEKELTKIKGQESMKGAQMNGFFSPNVLSLNHKTCKSFRTFLI